MCLKNDKRVPVAVFGQNTPTVKVPLQNFNTFLTLKFSDIFFEDYCPHIESKTVQLVVRKIKNLSSFIATSITGIFNLFKTLFSISTYNFHKKYLLFSYESKMVQLVGDVILILFCCWFRLWSRKISRMMSSVSSLIVRC